MGFDNGCFADKILSDFLNLFSELLLFLQLFCRVQR